MRQINPFLSTMEAWMELFMRHSMHNFVLFSKQNNLSMPQIGALFRIHHKGVCGVSDIGDELGISSAAASQMLERLVQQQLIYRTEDPNDRRGKQIVLTEKGLAILRESMQARQAWLSELAEKLTPDESEQVVAAMQILIQKTNQLDDFASPAPKNVSSQ